MLQFLIGTVSTYQSSRGKEEAGTERVAIPYRYGIYQLMLDKNALKLDACCNSL